MTSAHRQDDVILSSSSSNNKSSTSSHTMGVIVVFVDECTISDVYMCTSVKPSHLKCCLIRNRISWWRGLWWRHIILHHHTHLMACSKYSIWGAVCDTTCTHTIVTHTHSSRDDAGLFLICYTQIIYRSLPSHIGCVHMHVCSYACVFMCVYMCEHVWCVVVRMCDCMCSCGECDCLCDCAHLCIHFIK